MGVWDIYQSRMNVHGRSKRDASLIRENRFLESKLPGSLSYHSVDIYPAEYGFNIDFGDKEADQDWYQGGRSEYQTDEDRHVIHQKVAIINSDNLDEKTIFSMPHEDIELGSLVYWMGNRWLVYERDANTTVYTRAKLIQCNHLLKWISSDGEIMEQWCVVEDGTKYLTGEYEDRDFATTRGDSRIAIQIARNQHTVAFDREWRFLVDDTDSPHKLAYALTKPLKRGLTYNNQGIFKFVLQEVTATDNDNHELGIADYYKYFPKESNEDYFVDEVLDTPKQEEKKVWI